MVRATEWEKEPEPVPVCWDKFIEKDGMGWARTCFDNARARGDIEVGGDKGDVGKVKDLGTVWEGHCP